MNAPQPQTLQIPPRKKRHRRTVADTPTDPYPSNGLRTATPGVLSTWV